QLTAVQQLVLFEEFQRRPADLRVGVSHARAGLEHVAHRDRAGRIAEVVATGEALLDAAARELREIAHVDELHRIFRRAGREHLAAARDAPRPIGEAIAAVARTDDVGRTNHRLAGAERLLDDLFARGLETAVILFGDLLRVWILERRELVVLVDARRR